MAVFPAPLQTLINFYRDREYFQQLRRLAIPIVIQQIILSSLNMVGVIMIGQKGETAVAAVGLANQVFFLLTLVLFGIGNGSAMFTAQLWGKRDIPNLRKVLSLGLLLGLLVSVVFLLLAELLPAQIMGIYSRDPQVIALGSEYLRIFGWAFIFFAITNTYSLILRSIGDVRLPMFVSAAALSVNLLLSYSLIFGKFGLPAMGVPGAAVAVLVSRLLECGTLLTLTYRRRSPVAATLHELLTFDFAFIINVLKPVLPVALNEFLWSMGITAYNVVYARIATGALAAINMVAAIDNLTFAFISGIANATAIMVGHQIGSNEEEAAFTYAGRSLGLGAATGMALGGISLLGAGSVLALYKVSPSVLENAHRILIIFALFLWLRAMNTIMVLGVLRSGGDTRFCLFLDGVIIWIIGVPAAFAGAFIFHLPVYWVYLLVMSEEVSKWIISLPRFFSRRWIHDLTQSVDAG